MRVRTRLAYFGFARRVLIPSAFALSACTDTVDDSTGGGDGDAGADDPNVTVGPDADTDVRVTSLLSDAEIAAVLVAANARASREGQLAPTRAADAAVKTFAERLVTEHTVAAQRDSALFNGLKITPRDNAMSLALTRDANERIALLQPKTGAAFDADYLALQVSSHAEVLGLLDYTLIPSTGSETLRAELQNARDMETTHLTLALTLQKPH